MAIDTSIPLAGHRQFKAVSGGIASGRRNAGRWLIAFASIAFVALAVFQTLYVVGATRVGFENWRPVAATSYTITWI